MSLSVSAPRPSRRRSLLALAGAGALVAPLAPAALAHASGPAGPAVRVRATAPVYLTRGGHRVSVPVSIRTADGRPLTHPVTVRVATGRGTAVAGRDYTPATRTLTFPVGTASGASRSVTVRTAARRAASVARTIPVTVSSATAGVQAKNAGATVVLDAHGLPYQDASLPVAARVKDLMSRMNLAEKIGQMTQAERGAVNSDQSQISQLYLGSLLSGGGSTPADNTPTGWADMVDSYQSHALATRLQIPLIYGIDSVHGDNNLVGATIFPQNIGMGATRNPALVRQEEHITAIETRATGPQWVFAPCLCVARDDRWGRTFESYGEDPALVEKMETGIDGFQGTTATSMSQSDHVLATAKHFAGDGLTQYGTGSGSYPIDQGIDVVTRADFARLALAPYYPAVRQHHVGAIMPSYSSVDWIGDGIGNPIKMSANKQLLTNVLKDKIGFSGFLISDYDAITQLPGTFADQVRTSVMAGMDMFMQPNDYANFERTLMEEVKLGQVPMSRIDDAVSRILTQKFKLGLFEHPYTDRSRINSVGSAAHRAVARKAAAQSQVLLKNDDHTLPLADSGHIYVAGSNADDLGNQAGGWTVTWQGQSGNDAFPGTTILAGMQQDAPNATITYSEDASAPMAGNDVGVVVVGETPYAEGMGDVGNNGHTMQLSDADTAAVKKVCTALPKCVVLVVSGRPLIVSPLLKKMDALVASWLPGSEGEGVADTLFGRTPFTGKLPVSWPRSANQEPINVGDPNYNPLFRYGFGLTTG